MIIRKATVKDAQTILDLITALAIYEKAEDQVTITYEQIVMDGFQKDPLFHTLIAELNKKTVAFALYYNRYSTWKGRSLYLEDLFVLDKYRGKQIGKKLFLELARIAKNTKCQRLEWQVLDWNQSAINFYKSMGAIFDSQWINCKFDSHQEILTFVNKVNKDVT